MKIALPGTNQELEITHNCDMDEMSVTLSFHKGLLYFVGLKNTLTDNTPWFFRRDIDEHEAEIHGRLPAGCYLNPIAK